MHVDCQSPYKVIEDERLVAELHRLGVRHLARFDTAAPLNPLAPADLIAALASHPQARMQGALILVFLLRPDYQLFIAEALTQLSHDAYMSLKLYYQAAVYLQRELRASLEPKLRHWRQLSDLFSAELGLPAADTILPGHQTAQAHLEALGEQHQRHSGHAYNWAGSYRQHIGLFIKHLGTHNA